MNHTRSNSNLRQQVAVASVGALAVLGGCNMFLPFVFMTEHKAKVPAEFDKLKGNRVLVTVWAPQETLFDYPHVRMELGLHIGERIDANVKKTDVVDGRLIEDYVQRSLSSAIDPEEMGKHFNADMVVYVELLAFQIRDPAAPDFLRANIEASVTVYDLTSTSESTRRYPLADVEVLYPPDNPVLFTATSAAQVRKAAYETFADDVSRKFYDHDREM